MNKELQKSILAWILVSFVVSATGVYLDNLCGPVGDENWRYLAKTLVAIGGIGVLAQCLRWAHQFDADTKSGGNLVGSRLKLPYASSEKLIAAIGPWAETMDYQKHESSSDGYLVFRCRKIMGAAIFIAARRVGDASQIEAWIQSGKNCEAIKPGFSFMGYMRRGRDDVNSLLAHLGEGPLK